MTKQKVFFSYSRADGSAFALRLAVDLKAKGFDVWMDQEDIRAGSEWDIEIEKALETCDCLLFIETERSVVSNNVLDEVYYALDENKKVIPVILVDSKTPFRLKRLQHIDFTKDYNTGLTLLVNELESNSTTVSYTTEPTTSEAFVASPATSKKTSLPFVVGSFVILIAAVVFLFTFKKNNDGAHPIQEATSAKDTLSHNNAITSAEQTDTSTTTAPILENSTERSIPIEKKQKATTTKANAGKQKTQRPTTTIVQDNNAKTMESNPGNLRELYAGDWRLADVEPKAQSHRGYLKIEALDAGKVRIKCYMQFYYPERKASSYLTIFNAFANCSSCVLRNDVKLIAEDVAVGSRTIKTLKEDQPDGGKAGDVILDANSNKSIRAAVTLHFIDANRAVIKVQQPETITLAHELKLEPFVYTFRFKKID